MPEPKKNAPEATQATDATRRSSPSHPPPLLSLRGLSKTFHPSGGEPVPAVVDAGLDLGPGELLALVGPSGCGKTTLLRLIAGLEEPDAGRIVLGDTEVTRTPPGRRNLAMVFQQPALFPHLTARENLAFGLRIRKVPGQEARDRVLAMADTLGLNDCLDRLPGELSGGQRQRVSLGRALVRKPALLLLDEPLSQLDGPLRLELRHEVARLHATLGLSIIYVTHDLPEALTLGRRVAVMNRGRIEQIAPPDTLRKTPATDFVARFLGNGA